MDWLNIPPRFFALYDFVNKNQEIKTPSTKNIEAICLIIAFGFVLNCLKFRIKNIAFRARKAKRLEIFNNPPRAKKIVEKIK
jgi:hypothetical protein